VSFFRSATLLGASQLINMVLTLVSRILLTRILGRDLFGEFGLALNNITVLSRIGSLGIAPASQYHAGKKQHPPEEVVPTAFWMSLVIGLGAFAVATLGKPWIYEGLFTGEVPHDQAWLVFYHMLPFLPVVIVAMSLAVMLIPLERKRAYTLMQATAMVPLILVALGLWKLVPTLTPLRVVISAQLAAWFWMLGFSLYHLWPWLRRLRFSKPAARELLRYGWQAWPNVVLTVGAARFVTLFGAGFVAPRDLSIYILGLNLAEASLAPYTMVGQLVLSRVADDTDADGKSTLQMMRLSWVLLVVIVLLFAVVGPWAVPLLFGAEFAPAVPVSIALCVTGFAHAQMATLSNFFAGKGQPGLTKWGLGAEVVAMFALLAWLGPLYGVWGLVGASIASAVLGWLVSTALLRRLINVRLRDQLLPTREDLALLKRSLGSLFGKRSG